MTKSDLLLRDEYGRRFAVLRMAEMLEADQSGQAGPIEIRVEQGVPGWDDVVERWKDERGVAEHRWQVKRQSTRLTRGEFEKLIRGMGEPGASFIAHLALRDMVDVMGIGPLRVLRDLTDRVRGDGLHRDDVDLDELLRTLAKTERCWVDAVVHALEDLPDRTVDERAALTLLWRLHVEILYDDDDLKRRAIGYLRIFPDPETAWQRLLAHVAANPYGHVRFTAVGLRQEPLQNDTPRHESKPERTTFDVTNYIARLQCFLGNPNSRVETGLQCVEAPIAFQEVCDRVSRGDGVIVTGPPGSGKTELLRALAQRLAVQGLVPVWGEAQRFEGHLNPWLDEAIAPLQDHAFHALRNATCAENRRIVLLVDGLEEANDKASLLLRDLDTCAPAVFFTIVIASRKRPAVMPAGVSLEVSVMLPDAQTKHQLFAKFSNHRQTPSAHTEALLATLSTPLEVELAAEAATDLPDHPTTYQIFDTYVRHRLRKEAGNAIIPPVEPLLRAVAASMAERFTTTIPRLSLSALAETERVPKCVDPVAIALRAGLLVERAGYARFRHDLFRMFFEAERLLLKHIHHVDDLAELVERPRYHELTEFLLGALDSSNDIERFIRRCSDSQLLIRGFEGRIGPTVEQTVLRVAQEMLRAIREEWSHLPRPQQTDEIEHCWRLLRPWSQHEQAVMSVVGRLLPTGRFWSDVVPALNSLDHWWLGIHLPDGIDFQCVREEIGRSLYFSSHVGTWLRSAESARWEIRDAIQSETVERAALPVLQSHRLWTPGVLILLAYTVPWRTPALRAHLPAWFDACWKTRLYHVRLFAAETLTFITDDLEEDVKRDMIALLQRIWNNDRSRILFGPIEYVMQALVRLGVMDHPADEYSSTASSQVQAAVAEPEADKACLDAYYAFSNQFDEHIGDAYGSAVAELEPQKRLLLLLRAAMGAYQVEFAKPETILRELLESGDARAAKAFRCWAQVPLRRTLMGDGAEAFVYANVGLGRLGHAERYLGAMPDAPVDRLWYLVGMMLRRLHCPTVNVSDDGCHVLWSHIQQEDPWLVVEMFRKVSDASQSDSAPILRDPGNYFRVEMCQIASKALENGFENMRSMYRTIRGPHLEPISYALSVLGHWGKEEHIRLLERFVEDPDWGRSAIDAIRQIQNRKVVVGS